MPGTARGDLKLRKESGHALAEMCHKAYSEGIVLHLLSAYRSFDYQETVFQRNIRFYGSEAEANRYSARPGQSEHQLGTAVDFGGTDSDWTEGFSHTKPARWLARNAYKFGFVMSYPPGTEHITGYVFEPWHYRYIGMEAAGEWHEWGLVLCEYLKTRPQQFIWST